MHEINLVPDIKIKMLEKIRLRNRICFICIVVAVISISSAVITGTVSGSQKLAMVKKRERIDTMSAKLGEYGNLNEFLTIQNQLEGISDITATRRSLYRIFAVLLGIVPHSEDKVQISELKVDLVNSRITMDAQADAGREPFIDYRVLESFRKGISLTKFDYGRYLDEEGNEIPVYCIKETDDNGQTYIDDKGNVYALWTINQEGCHPAVEQKTEGEDDESEEDTESTNSSTSNKKSNSTSGSNSSSSSTSNSSSSNKSTTNNSTNNSSTSNSSSEAEDAAKADENYEEKIMRTPLFNEWVTQEHMDKDTGEITGIPHFKSECITYTSNEINGQLRWTYDFDESCSIIGENESSEDVNNSESVIITDSSNAKDADDNLVLRFSATISLNPNIFLFANKHVLVIGPEAQDVTDSYRQISGIFGKAATDCKDGDTECDSNTSNAGRSSSNSNNKGN